MAGASVDFVKEIIRSFYFVAANWRIGELY